MAGKPPPTKPTIRRETCLIRAQKLQLSKRGNQAFEEMLYAVYMAFRSMGCKAAAWDNSLSMSVRRKPTTDLDAGFVGSRASWRW